MIFKEHLMVKNPVKRSELEATIELWFELLDQGNISFYAAKRQLSDHFMGILKVYGVKTEDDTQDEPRG
jgi:hypothetical protein